MAASSYIRGQGHVERTLKLIASVSVRRDVNDFETGLLLANTQAVRRITQGKTFFSRRLYLTSDDWKQCEDLPVPSRPLFLDELTAAGVHINSSGEIRPGPPLVPLLLPREDPLGDNTEDPNLGGDNSGNIGGASGDAGGGMSSNTGGGQSSNAGGATGDAGGGKPTLVKVMGGGNLLKVKGRASAGDRESLASARKDSGRLGHGPVGENTSDLRHGSDMAGGTALQPGAPDTQNAALHGWLHCRHCAGLQLGWCEDVLCMKPIDLVGSLGILGAYIFSFARDTYRC